MKRLTGTSISRYRLSLTCESPLMGVPLPDVRTHRATYGKNEVLMARRRKKRRTKTQAQQRREQQERRDFIDALADPRGRERMPTMAERPPREQAALERLRQLNQQEW